MSRVFVLSFSSISAETVQPWVRYYIHAISLIAQRVIVHADKRLIKQLEAEMPECVSWKESCLSAFKDWQSSILDICIQKTLEPVEEIVLCDDSSYGPIFSLEDTFSKMDEFNYDFWSATFSNIAKADGTVERVPETTMMVLKSDIIRIPKFQQFWKDIDTNLPSSQLLKSMINILSELRCSCGYLMNEEKYGDIIEPLKASQVYAHKLICDKVPFVTRGIFYDISTVAKDCLAGIGAKVLQAIKINTSYPADFIWTDILSSQKMSDIKDALQLNYILGNTTSCTSILPCEAKCIALICYVYYEDLCPYMCRYLSAMPREAHICIISSNPSTLEAYKIALKSLGFNNVDYRLKQNRGRDVAALLVTARDVVKEHEYVCFVHDKKSKHFQRIVAEGHLYHCMECCLHNRDYVVDIINLFQREQRCGLLVPPVVNFGPYNIFGYEQGMNAASMRHVYDMLKLNCPMDDSPVTSFGTCFWARSNALAPMYNHDWDYTDFPDEPMPSDGTISHGIERILPVAVQHAGFYTSWVSPIDYAGCYMNDLAYKFRQYNQQLFRQFGYQTWSNMINLIGQQIQKSDRAFHKCENLDYLKRKYRKRKIVYSLINIFTFGAFRKKYRRKIRSLRARIDEQRRYS